MLVADMLDYVPAGRAELKNSAGVSHRLRVCVSGSAGVCVCVYIAALQHSQFSVLQLVSSNNTRYSLEHISTIYSTQVHMRARAHTELECPTVCNI